MVSVIMPCYNAGKYIREAIESVVNQTYQDWELIIVNDGSTDNSQQVVEDYIKSSICNLQSRVRLINQPNSGACRARNNGIDHAQGEYIKFLDADDILVLDAIEKQIEQIKTLQPQQIPFGDYGFIDENDVIIAEHQFDHNMDLLKTDQVEFFFREWRVLITCPLHRTELLREIGGFNEQLKRGQESDLHLRLAVHDVEFVYFPTKLFYYRQHQAEQRISCHCLDRTKSRQQYWEIRNALVEKMFLKKYGVMPDKYRTFFRNVWYNKARRQFAEGQIEDGKASLKQMHNYYPAKKSQQCYIIIGKCFGYNLVEKILQLRLRLLGKQLKD